MTEQQHPITPPPHLIEQWSQDHCTKYALARQAAQWGADQELEACCEWLGARTSVVFPVELRAARRPKPPSLKEEALEELDAAILRGDCFSTSIAKDIIRRALKSIPDPS